MLKTSYIFILTLFLGCTLKSFSQNADCQTFINQAKQAKTIDEKDNLLRKAADCGDESTQFYLGYTYYDVAEGHREELSDSIDDMKKFLIEIDIKNYGNKAIKYLEMAAKTGHPGAQAYLCVIYYQGHFVKENFKEAELWANKVKSNRRSTSKEIDAVEAVLGRIEMIEALEALGW